MWGFGKSDNLAQLEQKIEGLKQRLDAFELSLEKFKSNLISLRGLVNRKMSGEDEETEESEEKKSKKAKSEDINNLAPKFL